MQGKDLFPLIIEGDSQIIIKMVSNILQGSPSSKISNSWRMAQRLQHIECWFSSHRAVSLKHIRREGNKVVDLLANMGVDCGKYLHVGPLSNLASESQLLNFNNLVQKDMPQKEEIPPDVGGTIALNAHHAG